MREVEHRFQFGIQAALHRVNGPDMQRLAG